MRGVLIEMGEVLLLGTLFALLANRLSPHGLRLGTDYFRRATPGMMSGSIIDGSPSPGPGTDRWPELSADEALGWFRHPGFARGQVVFVDARKESAFEEGHIPGALPLDRFHPESQLPAVVLAGVGAETVVVYCTGGACEDSHYAAQQLAEAGLERSRIRIFSGGITEWASRGWPVERGARGSGRIEEGQP